MKKISVLFSILLFSIFGYGQAYEGAVFCDKKIQSAAVIDLPYSPLVVNAALVDYLSKRGKSRSKDVKGFTTFTNTEALQGHGISTDLYFRTERKNDTERDISVVSLLVTDEYQTTRDNLHYLSMDAGKEYLNGLATAVDAYGIEIAIKDQNDVIIKLESKNKVLSGIGQDLENKRIAIEQKIAENKNDQQQLTKEIERQKQKLTECIGQRKS